MWINLNYNKDSKEKVKNLLKKCYPNGSSLDNLEFNLTDHIDKIEVRFSNGRGIWPTTQQWREL